MYPYKDKSPLLHTAITIGDEKLVFEINSDNGKDRINYFMVEGRIEREKQFNVELTNIREQKR